MSMLLRGAPAAAALNEKTAQLVSGLREKGVVPTLAIVRLGAREDDLLRAGGGKALPAVGIETRCVSLPENVSGEALEETLRAWSADASVHGILLLRPLPAALDEARAYCAAIAPEKDVDGAAEGSLAAVYAGTDEGFAPLHGTGGAELLDYYEIPIEGKRAVVLGRSLVVGRPAAMLLLHRATVTLCHSKTENAAGLAREADILIAAAGRRESVGAAYFRAGQTVIDVGIRHNEETQKLCGDVALAEADGVVRAVTPVPGGVAPFHHGSTGRAPRQSRGAPDKIIQFRKTHDRVGAKRKVPRMGCCPWTKARAAAVFAPHRCHPRIPLPSVATV